MAATASVAGGAPRVLTCAAASGEAVVWYSWEHSVGLLAFRFDVVVFGRSAKRSGWRGPATGSQWCGGALLLTSPWHSARCPYCASSRGEEAVLLELGGVSDSEKSSSQSVAGSSKMSGGTPKAVEKRKSLSVLRHAVAVRLSMCPSLLAICMAASMLRLCVGLVWMPLLPSSAVLMVAYGLWSLLVAPEDSCCASCGECWRRVISVGRVFSR